MAIFKCKMCGGTLEILSGSTTAECEYCGSKQSLPRVSDDRLTSFYERANDLRMSHEFDKAIELYERIIEENPTDADAYWSMVLCRYGIEYVEETKGGPRKPTINRAQLKSVFEDVDYRAAIKYADAEQRSIYEEEAAKIDRILQKYLEISRNEPPYDVFICYKETGLDGGRTIDAVRAGEIYRELTGEGFKVFYAPATLENKLGEDYEPYIFAAINSAKVMVVIGTKPEHMNAVWVKNEWSRFLTVAKNDSKKVLIPVYSGMDPYDMPEAFRFKQSQDMSKIGFMLDLVRGIEKIVGKNNAPKTATVPAYQKSAVPTGNVDTMLQRVAIFLDDRDWGNANIYCEKVLDINPTNGQAYLYKLLSEARITNEHALASCGGPLENMKAYKNAVRYADEATSARLIEYNRKIKDRLAREEAERQEQERIRREQARQQEERRQRHQALTKARDNAEDCVKSQIREKEELEQYLTTSQHKAQNLQKYKRKIQIPAIMIIINAVFITLLLITNGDTGLGFFLMFVQVILSMVLAGARDKSKIATFVLQLFTCCYFSFFSAIKGLTEATGMSTKELYKEQLSINTRLRELETEITASRNALSELNGKLENFD